MQFLAATRSIRPAKDKASPFRMKQPILLPKFGRKVASDEVDRPENIPDASVGTADGSQDAKAELVTTTNRRLAGLFQDLLSRGGGGCGSESRSPVGGEKTGNGLVQAELSLEAVRVVRNDLNEHTAMQGTPLAQVRAKESKRVRESWWKRLRLFARARKQD